MAFRIKNDNSRYDSIIKIIEGEIKELKTYLGSNQQGPQGQEGPQGPQVDDSIIENLQLQINALEEKLNKICDLWNTDANTGTIIY